MGEKWSLLRVRVRVKFAKMGWGKSGVGVRWGGVTVVWGEVWGQSVKLGEVWCGKGKLG